jgi:leader peptidase (prepilin peptidase) / N-methyltransferase
MDLDIYYCIVTFIFGTVLGSFFNVVGDRLANDESIIKPRSHCPHCRHKLGPSELIPIVSYLIQGGKCKHCHKKIPVIHPIYEALCGFMFALTYYVFKFTPNFWITLTLLSVILIIFVSDIEYMIIPDQVLIVGLIILAIERIGFYGIGNALMALLYGFAASYTMYLIKLLGDYLFKKESMGGGDIKLMFVLGYVLGYPGALIAIVLGSFIGLPMSYYIVKKNKSHEIPFGPLLGIGALLVMYFGISLDTISKFIGI